MGKNDVVVKRWISKKERFADLFNAWMYRGDQVILAEELEDVEGESDIIIRDKAGKEKVVHRFRDVVMRWKKGAEFMILASENQEKVHYTMPVRNMVYDGLSYTEQIEKMWREHREKGDPVTGDEFLSRMKKDDKLKPIITIVFYYGEKPWDGSTDIYGMLDLSGKNDPLKKYISNYHINLIDAGRIEDLTVFRSDLQWILGMLQYRSKKDELKEYIETHRDFFSELDYETYQMAKVLLNSEKQLGEMNMEEGKETVDMCKALDDLYKDGVEKGIEAGRELNHRLKADGRMEDLLRAIDDSEYQRQLLEEYGITQISVNSP